MPDTIAATPPPRRRHRWLRILAWVLGVAILLAIGLYFVVTSSAFVQRVILPKVSKSINARVTVSDASVSPFKEVVLRDLKIQTTGSEPVVSADQVRLRYSLFDILKGNIHVSELLVAAPAVTVVENPDGTSNLDPILNSFKQKEQAQQPAKPSQPSASKPPQIDIEYVALTNGTIRQVKNYANGTRDVTELKHVNFALRNLQNNQSGKLALSADIQVDKTNGMLQARMDGDYTFALTADLKPGSIQGSTSLAVGKAEGELAHLAGFGSEFKADVAPTEIKQVLLQFQKGGTNLGHLAVRGPFDMQKLEGRLQIVLAGIDKKLLNLAATGSGVSFGNTTINSTNQIDLAKGGATITATGEFNINDLQLTRTNQTTPKLNLQEAYDVVVDRDQGLATLRRLTITGTQNGSLFLDGRLNNPMNISWANTNNAMGNAELTLTVTNLDLADWKAFLGEVAPQGMVNSTLKVASQQGGRLLDVSLGSRIDRLTIAAGSNHLADAVITLDAQARATDLKQFNLMTSKLELAHNDRTLAVASASGTYDQDNSTADIEMAAHAVLAALLQSLPQPGMNINSGVADMKMHLTQQQEAQTVTGACALTNFTGLLDHTDIRDWGATAEFEVAMSPQQVEIRKVAGKLTEGKTPGGSFAVSGNYDRNKTIADLKARLMGFNQHGIGPFLQPSLGDKQLVSVLINANASARYDPQGASALQADLQVTNLVVNDPTGQVPAAPLEARMQVDTALQNKVAEIRQFLLSLTPTARATNQVQMTGRVDMSQTNAIQGDLKLAADSLDLTTYYDLFVGNKPGGKAAQPEPTPGAPGGANQEPEPIQLPARNFTALANIGRLYLHDVEITNCHASTQIDGGHVVIKPVQLSLNGAPISATVDLNLGVRGWQYDLSFGAKAVPLAPLVDTFQPERKGQLGGTVTLQGQIKGAGITGAGLQKNLAGRFDLSTTNMNLKVINIRNPLLRTIINVVAGIPEIVRNPAGKVASILGNVTGLANNDGGLAGELQHSPIDTVMLQTAIANGRVDLKQALVKSPSFAADAGGGNILLGSELTNSTLHIPVVVYLSVPIANQLNLVPSDTPTNATYARLPDFLTIKGIIGKPDPDINKVALVGTAVKSVTGGVEGLGEGVVGAVGNILGIKSSGTNDPSSTNQAPLTNPFKGIFGPKKK